MALDEIAALAAVGESETLEFKARLGLLRGSLTRGSD